MMIEMRAHDLSGPESLIRAFYESVAQGDDATSGDATPGPASLDEDFVLQVPEWGLEVSGGDASIAWLRSEAARLRPSEIVEVILRDPVAVVLLRRRGAEAGTDSCHVLRFDGEHIRSCCIVPPAG